MAHEAGAQTPLPAIGDNILTDVERLLKQHLEVLRHELVGRLDQVEGAGMEMGAGGGALLVAGIFSGVALAHLLKKAAGLPGWAAYGVTAGLFAGAGASLLAAGSKEIAAIDLFDERATPRRPGIPA
jgi:hypothetical protein